MAKQRIRGRALQRIRKAVFRVNPICARCGRKIATQCDHVEALANGGVDHPSPLVNRQGLCDECHKLKTNKDLGRRPRLGCDVNGQPIDPTHPWNRGGAG